MHIRRFAVIVSIAAAAHAMAPGPAYAQTSPAKRDSLWNGVLIGMAIGAVAGMWVAPPAFCGRNDSECAAIVRVAIGLPSIAAGAGAGALIDGLHKSRSAGPAPFRNASVVRFRIAF